MSRFWERCSGFGIGAIGVEAHARLFGEGGEGFLEVEAVEASVEVEDVAGGWQPKQ